MNPDLLWNLEPRRKQTSRRIIMADFDHDLDMLEIRTTHGTFTTTVLLYPHEMEDLAYAILALTP